MRYERFLELREPVWERFEAGLNRLGERPGRGPTPPRHEDLEALALDYRQVLHDQALASARFAGTAADRRLRRLAVRGTRILSRDPAHNHRSLLRFFTRSYPRVFRRHLPLLGIVSLAFLAITLFGLAASIYRPSLGVTFLGPGALAGLKEGRMWTEALTSAVPPAVSSSFIATNNLSVAITAWAGGALAGVLTVWVVINNGLMLGSIIGVTLHYSMAHRLFEFIAAHGPLELSLILVAATAGLVLGRGMVVAEDLPRRVVLNRAARESLTLLAGTLPWFVLLGIVEGLISPSTQLSLAFKAAVGLSLEALFLIAALNPFLRETSHERP